MFIKNQWCISSHSGIAITVPLNVIKKMDADGTDLHHNVNDLKSKQLQVSFSLLWNECFTIEMVKEDIPFYTSMFFE